MAENKWGDWEHCHPPADRTAHTSQAAMFYLLQVIVRPFLLLLPPQKSVNASFNGAVATQKSAIANKTNIKWGKSQRQSIIQTSHNTQSCPSIISSPKHPMFQPNGFVVLGGANTMSSKPTNVVFLWNCWSLGVLSVYVSVVGFVGLEPGGSGREGRTKMDKKKGWVRWVLRRCCW